MTRRIDRLWAVVVKDEHGHEGIAVEEAILPPGLPIISGHRLIVEQRAEALAEDPSMAGKRVAVVSFRRETPE